MIELRSFLVGILLGCIMVLIPEALFIILILLGVKILRLL